MFLKKRARSLVSLATLGALVAGLIGLGPITGASAVTTTTSGTTVTHTYNNPSATETLTIPSNVSSIDVTLIGGEGARGGRDSAGLPPAGNFKGSVTGTIAVTPGSVLTIAVGGGAVNSSAYDSCSAGIAADTGDSRASVSGKNPLTGYDGGDGGSPGQDGCSGYGGGGGAASVILIGTAANDSSIATLVAGGGGGNGGSGQWAEIHGKISLSTYASPVVTPAIATNGEQGKYVYRACIEAGQGRCDGGGGAGGGGGYLGGGRGVLEFGQGSLTEWFGHGGSPGTNYTNSYAGLAASYIYSATNNANGSIVISYSSGTPGQPTGLTAAAGNTSADLYWTAPTITGNSAITSYQVEYAPGAGYSAWTVYPGCSNLSTSCTVAGLTNGTSYKFRVSAINSVGTGSASALSSAVTPSGPPTAPTITGITPGDGQLSVAFTAATSSLTITSYQYTVDGGTTWITKGTTSPIVITGLFNGTVYSVKLRAVSAAGNGTESAASNATPSALPGSPTITAVTAGGDGTSLVVTFVSGFTGGSTITDYEYATSVGENTSNFGAFASAGLTSPFTITGLQNGTTYTVQLRAKNSAGAGPASAFRTGVTLARPNAPVLSAVTAGDTSLSLGYTAYTDSTNGGSAISKIEYSVDGGVTWVNSGTLANPFVVSGLQNGTSYNLKIRATNAVGVSDASNLISGTPAGVSTAPRTVSVIAGQQAVTVSWSAPNSTNGSAITGYTARAYNAAIGGSLASSCTTTHLTCTISSLTNGITYYIDVIATNGVGSSIASSPRVSALPAALPGAPTLGAITAGNAYLSVAFTAGTADANAPITGYQYSTDGGTTWANATGTSSPILITGLANGTTYSVKLRANSAVGFGSASNAGSGKPFSAPDSVASGTISYVANNGSVDVTWVAPSNNGATITSYEVTAFSAEIGGSQSSTCSTSGAVTCRLNSLSNGTTYYVSIQAVNSAGYSPRSTPRIAVRPGTASSVALTSSSTAFSVGTSVTLTATVTNGATGTVNFIAGNTSITGCSAQAVSANVATCTTSSLAVGNVAVKANYSGNATYSSSESAVVNISVAAIAQTITFNALSNKFTTDTAFTVTATGGASANAVIFSSATPSVCTATGSNGATITLVSAGTCTINANQAGSANYSAANQVGRSFTVSARHTVTYDVNYGVQSQTTDSYTVGGTALTLPSPTRSNFVFTGWYSARTGGNKIGDSGAPYQPNAATTLYGRWVQNSLYGMGSSTKIGTMTTVNGIGTTFSANGTGSQVSINYTADALPASTVIDVYLLSDTSRAQRLITSATSFVVSLVVAWLAADETVPTTAAGKALSMTITNADIKAGAKVYQLINDVATEIGTATQDGSVTVSITEDPEITIVNPATVQSGGGSSGGGSSGGGAVTNPPTTPTDPNDPTVLPPLEPGAIDPKIGANVLVGNDAVTPTVGTSAGNTKLSVKVDSFALDLVTQTSKEVPNQLDGFKLTGTNEDSAKANGSGLDPLSIVKVYVFSSPIYLGTATVNAQGQFVGLFDLPAGLEVGSHTLQISGFNSDKKRITTSVSLTVKQNKIAKTVFFAAGSATLSKAAMNSLDSLIRSARGLKSLVVEVTGTAQKTSDSRKDKALAIARSNAVAKYLKSKKLTAKIVVKYISKATNSTATGRSASVIATGIKN